MTHRETGQEFDAEEVLVRALKGKTIEEVRVGYEAGAPLLVLKLSDTSVVKLPFEPETLLQVNPVPLQ